MAFVLVGVSSRSSLIRAIRSMSTPAPIDPKVPAPESSAPVVPVEPPFEEKLRQFWAKNARTVYALCVVVLLAIIGRGALEYYQRQQEADVRSEYALASTPDKLKAFVGQHPKHTLAGVASLRMADDAYSAGNYAEAQTNYQRAADLLSDPAFSSRARLGVAVAKIALGQTADGEEKLKQLSSDVTQVKPVRAEAAYHLATLALEAGRKDDAAKYLDLVGTIDATSTWAERALMLRASLPASAAPAPAAVNLPSKR